MRAPNSASARGDDDTETGSRSPEEKARVTAAGGAMHRTIETKVSAAFSPAHLEVVDESYMHSVPEGAESHFRVLVVSGHFEGKTAVQRHQAVYAVLADEVKNHIHALGLQTMTPTEWAADQARNTSPECLGGGKAEG